MLHEPKHGQIFLFRFPPNPQVTYIKRVVGVPGDHIEYNNKVLYINGVKTKQKLLETTHYIDENGIYFTVNRLKKI